VRAADGVLPATGVIRLKDDGDKVRFRDIWMEPVR
jgi:hypothetical protein